MRILLFLLLPLLSSAQTTRVISYNLRFDNPGDGDDAWPKRRDFLAAQLRFHAPDVFGVQEALHHQLTYLGEELPGFTWLGAGRDDGAMKGEYSALFFRRARFDSLTSGTFWLSLTPERPSKGWDAALPRVCTYARLRDRLTGRTCWFFNTHFDHIGREARHESAELILRKMNELNRENEPVVVLGDLNAEPAEAPIAALKRSLHDAAEISVEPAFGPTGTFNGFEFHKPVTRRIDYIFVGPGLTVQRFATLSDNRDCHYPSDHFPILCDIE